VLWPSRGPLHQSRLGGAIRADGWLPWMEVLDVQCSMEANDLDVTQEECLVRH